jgi:hypothetical protein
MKFYGGTVTGSLTVNGTQTINGTLTAQTLVVQTITSSISRITGSTQFGQLASNTHQFTGSVIVTGSLSVVTTGTEFQVNTSGVKMGNISTDTHSITGSVLITGSIGIGTTSPIAPLHIYSNNQNVASTLATAYSNAKFRLEPYNTSGQGISMGSIGGYQQYIQAQYSDQTTPTPLLLQPFSGSVGIGTSGTPTTPLQVYSNIASTSNVTSEFYNADYTAGTRNFIRVRNGVTVGSTQSSYFGQGQDGKTYIISNDFTKNHIVINSANNNIGIGTNTPASILGIDNSANANTTAITITGYSSTPKAHIGQFSNNLYISSNWYYSDGQQRDTASFGSTAIVLGTGTADADNYIDFSTGPSGNSTPTNRMRITSAGRVGIENTAPQGKFEIGNAAINSTYGGHFFSTFTIPVNTWYTVYAAPSNSQWNAITEFTWTSAADSNRSGAAYMRWAYESGAGTLGVVYTLFNNSQNATATFRKSGNEIQINITGGAANYYTQVRIQGSQATS